MALVCLCRGNFYWPPHTTILFCSIFLDKIVLDTLKSRYHRSAPLGIPPDIENYMEEYNSGDDSAYEQTTLKQFYEIKYGEVINAINFFKPDAVYSTDHGVKGEEYENVLFVMGRGWNLCKFEDSLYKDEKSLQGKELATYIRN